MRSFGKFTEKSLGVFDLASCDCVHEAGFKMAACLHDVITGFDFFHRARSIHSLFIDFNTETRKIVRKCPVDLFNDSAITRVFRRHETFKFSLTFGQNYRRSDEESSRTFQPFALLESGIGAALKKNLVGLLSAGGFCL